VQAAFTTPEVRELGELAGAEVCARPEEVALDPLSRAQLAASDDRALAKKVEILEEFAHRPHSGKPKLLTLRFLVSPVELLADAAGGVRGMRLAHNRLEDDGRGGARAVPTGRTEELPVDLVFRSVGYRGVALAGLPFDDRAGIVPNAQGRVLRDGRPLAGIYVTGWIKRGPSGVIGTNKPCAVETVDALVADVERGVMLHPDAPDPAAADALVRARQPDCVTYPDWLRVDQQEIARGQAEGRPRVKYLTAEEMLGALAGKSGGG
jgi:ferredoxin--NADP+ reductase